tara:strand:+ start:2672 stop:2806 length:135 start_codon:yes stop_codon:yes gene_type:complete
MAQVVVQFKDDFGCFLDLDQKQNLDRFIEKFKNEIPGLSDFFIS